MFIAFDRKTTVMLLVFSNG